MTLLWMMHCATVFVSEPRFSLNFVVKFVHSSTSKLAVGILVTDNINLNSAS